MAYNGQQIQNDLYQLTTTASPFVNFGYTSAQLRTPPWTIALAEAKELMEKEFIPTGNWEEPVKKYIEIRDLAHKWQMLSGYSKLAKSGLMDGHLADHPGWRVLDSISPEFCTCHAGWKPTVEEAGQLLNKVAVLYGNQVQEEEGEDTGFSKYVSKAALNKLKAHYQAQLTAPSPQMSGGQLAPALSYSPQPGDLGLLASGVASSIYHQPADTSGTEQD